MATTNISKRVNRMNPAERVVTMLDEIAEKMKDTALLIAEYATQFSGQIKAEMDSSCASLRSMRKGVVAARMTVEDAEDARI